jgi:tetratricopeptide (TPR) repeat protein
LIWLAIRGQTPPVSAAPLPKPTDDLGAGTLPGREDSPTDAPERLPPDRPEDDGWALLEGLRRRLDDQTSQGRKTHQQVSQLTESIAALVELQRARTRGINLNSFVAYLIFTVLLGIGFYVLYSSRANELVEARQHADRERDTAVRRADDLAAKAAARDEADTRAWEVFQLLEAGKRSEATGKLAALRDLKLSRTERAILAARAHETQIQEVDAALKAATTSFKAGRYADVIAPLEAALISESTGSRAAAMRYFLGIAYAKGTQLDKAIPYLQAALDADVEHDDVRFHLASALDRSGAYAKARTEYDKFATAFPQSQFAVYAMRRSSTLAKMPANAPPPEPTPAELKPDGAAGSAAKPAAKPTMPPTPAVTPPTTQPAVTTPVKPPPPAPNPATAPGAKPATPPVAKPATPPVAKPATPPVAKPATPATEAPKPEPTPPTADPAP